ncbi:MAG: HigA family addiction module antidote protein [Eggerthellaceae bacterium]|nr:HigA family addiction module antidote protein [Eggerthellaceae bacterium]
MQSEGMVLITKRPPHPGEFLREDYLPECGLTVAAFADRLGVSRQTANELVREKRAISPNMALRLARLFGTTPQYWLNLQRNVDLWDSLELDRTTIENVQPLQQVAAG